jgi:alkylation response protein AidB-like acyl-CoA dehydrogenase
MTGDAHFNEVFLDNVHVPAANVLGPVHGGWRVARTMLAFERQALAAMGSGGSGRGGIHALITEARARGTLVRPDVRQRIADLRIRQMVLRFLAGHLEANRGAGRSTGGEASLLKLAMARLVQDSADAAVDIAGPAAIAWQTDDARGGRWCDQLLNAPSASIGGGTNEIVRNVIAERVLGLPRDVEVDVDVPFRALKVGTQRGS